MGTDKQDETALGDVAAVALDSSDVKCACCGAMTPRDGCYWDVVTEGYVCDTCVERYGE